MDTVSIPTQLHSLNDKWNMYYHLPENKNWDLSSYTVLMGNIDSVESVIALNNQLHEHVVRNCMLFVMRDGITPMWEDPKNRSGGCFSYKINNKAVAKVWKELSYVIVGDTISKQQSFANCVTGITISPKKSFCIVKIWMADCSNQNPELVTNELKGIVAQGCLFKKHAPEF